jgi:predicted lipoprotein
MAAKKKPAPAKPVYGRNRTAVEEMLEAMRSAGLLENIDAARVTMLQTLADAVDMEPTNASLWREYRAAESSIRENTAHDQDDFQELLASLSAEVRNSSSS